MDLYHTTDVDGISILNPDVSAMRELIDALDDLDPEDADHPDIALVHDPSGWSISLYPNRVAALENLDSEAEPHYLKNVTRREALELWVELSKGEIEKLKRRPWLAEA